MKKISLKKRVILASASPRRSELLKKLISEFEIIPSSIDERFDNLSPENNAMRLAAAKSSDVAANNKYAIVIGADTLVSLDGNIFGKPVDKEDAFRMLRLLSGKKHIVTTGISIHSDDYHDIGSSSTAVRFKDISDTLIREYIETGEPMDKAGAYAVQGGWGGEIVFSYSGSYTNVVGLPMELLGEMLRNING